MMVEWWVLFFLLLLGSGAAALVLFRWRARQKAVWTPVTVAALLDAWCNDDLNTRDWQALELARLGDPGLEEIRREAVWATYLGSDCVTHCGTPDMRLTDEGKVLFRRLSSACKAMAGKEG